MYELKTKLNTASVGKFLNSVKDKQKREDSFKILDMMKKITKEERTGIGHKIKFFASFCYFTKDKFYKI